MIDTKLHKPIGHFKIECLLCGAKNSVGFYAGGIDIIAIACEKCGQIWGTNKAFIEGIRIRENEHKASLEKGD